jgi:large subunit ribosomal protein L18
MATVKVRTQRRKGVTRRAVKTAANGRARLHVHRSGKHIYAQIIDDVKGATVASASSLEKDLRAKTGANVEAAKVVGTLVAKRAVEKGIKDVVFDRGAFRYHGRIKAVGDAAREAGLNF